MNLRTPLCFALAFTYVASAWAAPKFGVKLGTVDFEDWQNGLVLKLPECKGSKNTPIQEMKFTVQERRVHVDRLKLVLYSGEELDIKIDKDVKTGTDPDWFKVVDEPKCISVLRIIEDEDAKVIPKPTRARLEIWGR